MKCGSMAVYPHQQRFASGGSMKLLFVALLLSAASLLGAGAATAAPAPARALPVVYGLPAGSIGGSNFFHPQVRPHGPVFFECDGFSWLVIRSYRNWGAARATGAGIFHDRVRSSRVRWVRVQATFRFYNVKNHHGHRYFSTLRVHLAHSTGGGLTQVYQFMPKYCPAW